MSAQGEFSFLEDLWQGVFHISENGGSARLRRLLSIPEPEYDGSMSKQDFTNRTHGNNSWQVSEIKKFLAYSQDEDSYKRQWSYSIWDQEEVSDKIKIRDEECLHTFETFLSSALVKKREWDNVVRQVCAYLNYIKERYKAAELEKQEELLAAGLYVLVAFAFLENIDKKESITLRFYRPPEKWDPVPRTEETGLILDDDLTMQEPSAAENPEDSAEDIAEHWKDGEQDGKLQTRCRSCGGQKLFFHNDYMRFWLHAAAGFSSACIWLCGVAVMMFMVSALDSLLMDIFPAYAQWSNDLVEHVFPSLLEVVPGVEELLPVMMGNYLFLVLAIVILLGRFMLSVNSVARQEKEKGYRWITYECKKCSLKYKEKVLLKQLPQQKRTLSFRQGLAGTAILSIAGIVLGIILFDVIAPAYYGMIPFFAVLLPTIFLKNLINHKLHVHLEQIPRGVFGAIFKKSITDEFCQEDEMDAETVEDDSNEEDETE